MDRSATAMGDKEEYGYGLVSYENVSQCKELADTKENEDITDHNDAKADSANEERGISEKEATALDGKEYGIPISLKASWNSEGHTKLISSLASGLMSTGNINAVKDAATYADTSDTLKEYDILHARKETNYISAAKRLYEAARSWNGGNNYSGLYEEADRYTSADESASERTATIKELKTAMRKAVCYNFQDPSKTGEKYQSDDKDEDDIFDDMKAAIKSEKGYSCT